MSLKPVAARWFEVLSDREHLGAVLGALARTGQVELEAHSAVTRPDALPDYGATLAEFAELSRRYRAYWPVPRYDPTIAPPETIAGARDSLAGLRAWAEAAEPTVATLQRVTTLRAGLAEFGSLLGAAVEVPLLALAQCTGLLASRLYALSAPPPPLQPGLLSATFRTGNDIYLAALGTEQDCLALDAELARRQTRRMILPAGLPLAVPAARARLAEQIAGLDAEAARARATLDELETRHNLPATLAGFAFLEWLVANVPRLPATEHFVWATGWTADREGRAIEAALTRAGVAYLLHFPSPPAGAVVPRILFNPPWLRPFELFVRLLGTPRVGEADPTAVVAILAPLLFGFMFGDVAQGAVLLGVGVACWRRVPALRLLVPGGLSAVVFGWIFGSVGAREDLIEPLWRHPLEAPLAVLAASVGLGVVVIAGGLLLDALEHLWRGEGWRWLKHRGGLAAAYTGLIASLAFPAGLAVFAGGLACAIVLPAIGQWRAAGAALGEALETLLQLAVNTVSFARVGAFALAHAGLSAAIVGIADATGGGVRSFVVLLLGNLVVLVVEGVVVGIQTTRLVLFEFFIRFLQADGRALRPLPSPPGTVLQR